MLQTVVFAEQRWWWAALKHSVDQRATPLGVCSIEQLVRLHQDPLGRAPDTTHREHLIRAVAPSLVRG